MFIKISLLAVVSALSSPGLFCQERTAAALGAGGFQVSLDGRGRVTSLKDGRTGTDYLPPGMKPALLSLRVGGEDLAPLRAVWSAERKTLVLDWGKGIRGEVSVKVEPTHIRFELVSLDGADKVELVLWGPYPTTIGETVGETVGMVRNGRYAIGIQSLELKTLGGFPTFEDDHEPSFNIFRTSDYVDVPGKVKVLYRGQTARPAPFGSVLQAYCRNRNKARVIPVWGHPRFVVPPLDDGGVVGTKIALFGCPAGKALERLGRIEVAEGLPHPMLDGKWGKVAPGATDSYLIMNFGEETLEQALEITKKAGLRYLYQGGPFRTWGHFELNPRLFPHGWVGLKKCVERAAKQGIRLGVHTLSNFITTNDAYVTPVPDPRLAKIGSTRLSRPAGPGDKVLYVEDTGFFVPPGPNALHTVRIEKELVRYGKVSKGQPWRLLDCRRGAFGTGAAAHGKGARVDRLMDHGYKVFLTDKDLSLEAADRIADLFNTTGLRQISFDGLEGNWSTGLGQYGRQRFVKRWWDRLKPSLQGKVITDASNPGHFFWHIFTRMNWGEPWYAGFRESQTRYRLMNQDYFRRNFIPPMLGWFRMSPATSLEDIEWLLARAAGYGAGFCLVTSLKTIERNGRSEAILGAIRAWERGRRAGIYPERLKKDLRDIHREFHLEASGKGPWRLYPLHVKLRNLHPRKKSPYESVHLFENPFSPRPLAVTLKIAGGKGSLRAGDIRLRVGRGKAMVLPFELQRNQFLRLAERGGVLLYDKAWNLIRSVQTGPLRLKDGRNEVRLSCAFKGRGRGFLKAEFRVTGDPIDLSNPGN